MIAIPPEMQADAEAIERGEYDVPLLVASPDAVILDIGANVGAFADWAHRTWPLATIHSYEPNPAALEYLRQNAPPRCTVHPVAVGREEGSAQLFDGVENLGCASFHDIGIPAVGPSIRGEGRTVGVVAASSLPRAHIVKIDTEGHELPILEGLDLSAASAVMLEYHREEDERPIRDLLASRGFVLYSALIRRPWLGTLRFLRRSELDRAEVVR